MLLGGGSARNVGLTADGATPLIRTWFGDDRLWRALLSAVETPSPEGFLAVLNVLDERSLEAATPQDVASLMPYQSEYTIAVLADQRSMTDIELPLLVVLADGSAEPPTMRVVASELWGIENNMSLANMEWDDFARSVDNDGVFRSIINAAE